MHNLFENHTDWTDEPCYYVVAVDGFPAGLPCRPLSDRAASRRRAAESQPLGDPRKRGQPSGHLPIPRSRNTITATTAASLGKSSHDPRTEPHLTYLTTNHRKESQL